MAFRNAHLSFSRIQRYAQCPKAFQLHYIEGRPSAPGIELKFGKAIHSVLEEIIGHHIETVGVGPLSTDYAYAVWQDFFGGDGLSGVGVFREGVEILRSFAASEGIVDARNVLGIEESFEIQTGRFTVVGAMDRVDRLDEKTIRIRDYKTNRLVFTTDEVTESLQLSLYAIAAETLWPWAERVELQFDMLRHGLRQRTSRTRMQLEAARRYIVAMGEQSERDEVYAARPNANCVYCDHRTQCSAYADALAGKRTIVATDKADLVKVAQEREEVARIAKAAYARKAELEGVLKARLEVQDKLELAGMRYQMSHACSLDYPLEPTLAAITKATGVTRDELVAKLATIDHDALEKLLKELKTKLPKPRVTLLQAELDARAERTITPRLWAKEVRA
jgi:putative RecB family exonuclease